MSIEAIHTKHLSDRSHTLAQLSKHALWVCFLNQTGHETFLPATFTSSGVHSRSSQCVPKDAELSSVQFWQDKTQITVLPTGYDTSGVMLFHTVEQLLEYGSVPEITAQNLAKRVMMQPYNKYDPASRIRPLLALDPLAQLFK